MSKKGLGKIMAGVGIGLGLGFLFAPKSGEATRKELIDQGKAGKATKAYGTNRYERRSVQTVYNTLKSFNKVDMNALFHSSLLSFIVPVRGETDNYEIEVLFEGITDDIKKEIQKNDNKLEYKCVYRALVNAVNRQDIYVACTCKDWQYRFAYHASKDGYNGGRPELRPADITNPKNDLGTGCKHVMAVLDNLDWAIKLATTIYNYIIYMEDHYEDKFSRIIYPTLYDAPYEDYKKGKGIFARIKAWLRQFRHKDIEDDDDNLANTMDNPEDEEEIERANRRGEYNPDVEEPEEEEEL